MNVIKTVPYFVIDYCNAQLKKVGHCRVEVDSFDKNGKFKFRSGLTFGAGLMFENRTTKLSLSD